VRGPAGALVAARTPRTRRLVAGAGLIGDYHGTAGGVDCDVFLTGDVDGVQIWSRALPVADIWRFLKALFSTSR
jgi:hypothetical protein